MGDDYWIDYVNEKNNGKIEGDNFLFGLFWECEVIVCYEVF